MLILFLGRGLIVSNVCTRNLWTEEDNPHNANKCLLPEGRNITANQRSLPAGQREQQHGGEVIVAASRLPELHI
jgi:hypothetical protein